MTDISELWETRRVQLEAMQKREEHSAIIARTEKPVRVRTAVVEVMKEEKEKPAIIDDEPESEYAPSILSIEELEVREPEPAPEMHPSANKR